MKSMSIAIQIGKTQWKIEEPSPAECELPADLSKGLSDEQQRQDLENAPLSWCGFRQETTVTRVI